MSAEVKLGRMQCKQCLPVCVRKRALLEARTPRGRYSEAARQRQVLNTDRDKPFRHPALTLHNYLERNENTVYAARVVVDIEDRNLTVPEEQFIARGQRQEIR